MIKTCFKCHGSGSSATEKKFNKYLRDNNILSNTYKLAKAKEEFNTKHPCKLCNKSGVLHYEKL